MNTPCEYAMTRSAAVLLFALTTCIIGLRPARQASAQTLSIAPRGARILPGHAIDQSGQRFPITGLSGITHLGGGIFAAVMDNSNKLIKFRVSFTENGGIREVILIGGLTLAEKRDFEAIAFTDVVRNSVFLSDENDPGVGEFSLSTGARLQSLTRPIMFNHFRRGYGFEALAGNAWELWVANEEALTGDGGTSTPKAGSPVRLQHYVMDGDRALADSQFVYVTDALHGSPIRAARSGLSDLVALPDGTMLALERSLASFTFQSRIYEIDFAGATDVRALPRLLAAHYTPVTKRLLWSGPAGGGLGQNLEGLALGPQLANGNWALLGVVDDADPLSHNTLVAFELSGAALPPPAAVGISFPLSRWWFFDQWRRR